MTNEEYLHELIKQSYQSYIDIENWYKDATARKNAINEIDQNLEKARKQVELLDKSRLQKIIED